MTHFKLGSLILLSSLTACTTSDEPADTAGTAETEQAVAWTSLAWHPCTQLSCAISLGPSTDRTCFIAGISGQLAGGSSSYPAGANVVDQGSWGYTLYIENPQYQNISVMTECIANTANRTTATWYSSSYATQIGPSPTGQRVCFLAGVWNRNSIGFGSFSSNTLVWKDGNYHYLGGSMPAGADVTVNATCVDATDVGDYSYANGSSTPFFGNLNYNPGGVACGLTSLGGQLTASDNSDAVVVNYNGGTRYWNLSVAPWTGAGAMCVQ